MPLYVSFCPTRAISSLDTIMTAGPRTREALAAGATSANSAQRDEILIVTNTESTAFFVATGSAPNASLSTATQASSAGLPVGPGQSVPLAVSTGDKVAVAAV